MSVMLFFVPWRQTFPQTNGERKSWMEMQTGWLYVINPVYWRCVTPCSFTHRTLNRKLHILKCLSLTVCVTSNQVEYIIYPTANVDTLAQISQYILYICCFPWEIATCPKRSHVVWPEMQKVTRGPTCRQPEWCVFVCHIFRWNKAAFNFLKGTVIFFLSHWDWRQTAFLLKKSRVVIRVRKVFLLLLFIFFLCCHGNWQLGFWTLG